MRFFRLPLPAVLFAAATLGPAVTQAQGLGAGLGTPTGPVVNRQPEQEKPREQAPPAIPGARAGGSPVVPAEKPPSDMTPNDALFDAINRGDIAAVRDAINRGAELRGKDILGLTPTELSIDLGRNDITFLLLSMRGSTVDDEPSRAAAAQPIRGARPGQTARGARVATATPPVPSSVTPAAPAGPRPGPVQSAKAAAPAPQAPVSLAPGSSTRPMAVAVTSAPVPIAEPASSRQFASGGGGSLIPPGAGGTPIPQMGFLGFGGVPR